MANPQRPSRTPRRTGPRVRIDGDQGLHHDDYMPENTSRTRRRPSPADAASSSRPSTRYNRTSARDTIRHDQRPSAKSRGHMPVRTSGGDLNRNSLGTLSQNTLDSKGNWSGGHRGRSPRRGNRSGGGWGISGLPIIPIALAVVVIIALAISVRGCMAGCAPTKTDDTSAAPVAAAETKVTFVAVGDNLPDDVIGDYADSKAGQIGDGKYDYTPIFAPITNYVAAADLAYIKQETPCGGDDLGPQGYPSFNTTDAMADAVVKAGFDLVGSASNHCYDWGPYGANEHSRQLWDAKADQGIVFTGTATSAQQAEELAIIERNGIKFCLLDYTYGVNAYSKSDLPEGTTNFISKKRITADVKRAKAAADVVMVAMHWGDENVTEATEQQMQYASWLTDLEVDLVLGSHPHVIGPVEKRTSKSGHETLVLYSLGNFLSNHATPDGDNQLEGMFSCTFVRDAAGAVSLQDPLWTPLVNHNAKNAYAVYAARDYTPELAAENPVFGGKDSKKEGWKSDPCNWLLTHSKEIVGDAIPVDGVDNVAAAEQNQAESEQGA